MVRNEFNGVLTAALRAVAEDEATRRASPAVEARLRSAVRAIAVARRRRQIGALALVATVIVAATVSVYRGVDRMSQPKTTIIADTPSAVGASEVTTDFLPLVYSSVPVTDGQIVRLEVPRTALAAFGLSAVDVVGRRPSETVLADVLVGEDGLARAVRFVRPGGTGADQEQNR